MKIQSVTSFRGDEPKEGKKKKNLPIQQTNENLKNNPEARNKFSLAFFSSLIPIGVASLVSLMSKKCIKNDEQLGIHLEDVKKVLGKIENKEKLKDKGLKVDFLAKGSDGYDVIAKFYGGAANIFQQKNKINNSYAIVDKASLIFHEIGHGLNAVQNKFSNLYRRALNIMTLPKIFNVPYFITILLTSSLAGSAFAYDNSKKDAPTNNKYAKFVHDNLVLLTSLIVAPKVIDETLATKKAFSLLKEHSPEMLKKIRGNYLGALGGYFATALGFIGTAAWARSYTDKLKNPSKKEI